MFELYYGLHKKQTIKDILPTFIASSIVNGCGRISNMDFTIDPKLFPKKVACFFNNIKLHRKNTVTWEDILDINAYFISDLKRNKFLIKIPFLGVLETRRFKKYIKRDYNVSNQNIIKYIDTNDLHYLDIVDKNINKIELEYPKSDVFHSYYRDQIDMYNNANYAKWGSIDPNRYRVYYTKSGERKKIEYHYV